MIKPVFTENRKEVLIVLSNVVAMSVVFVVLVGIQRDAEKKDEKGKRDI